MELLLQYFNKKKKTIVSNATKILGGEMKYFKKNMENKKVKSLKLWFFILFLAFDLLYSAIPQINMEVEASTQQLNTKKKTLKVGKDY